MNSKLQLNISISKPPTSQRSAVRYLMVNIFSPSNQNWIAWRVGLRCQHIADKFYEWPLLLHILTTGVVHILQYTFYYRLLSMASLITEALDSLTLESTPALPTLFTGFGASLNDDEKAKIVQVLLHFRTIDAKLVEEAFSHFTILSELSKESVRGPLAEKILVLAFQENAVTESSSNFEVFRTSVWYVLSQI